VCVCGGAGQDVTTRNGSPFQGVTTQSILQLGDGMLVPMAQSQFDVDLLGSGYAGLGVAKPMVTEK